MGLVPGPSPPAGGAVVQAPGAAPAPNPARNAGIARRLGSGLLNLLGARLNAPPAGGNDSAAAPAGVSGGSAAGEGQGVPVSTGFIQTSATLVTSVMGRLALGGSQASGTGIAVNQLDRDQAAGTQLDGNQSAGSQTAGNQVIGPAMAPDQAAATQPPANQAAVPIPGLENRALGTGQTAIQMQRVISYGAMDDPPPLPAGYHHGRLFSLPRGSPPQVAVAPGSRLVQLVHIDPVQDWQRPHIFYRLYPQRRAPLMADARSGRQILTIAIPDSWPIMTSYLN